MLQRLSAYGRLARFNNPAGTLLLLWPTLWGLWAAARGFPGWYWLAVFVGGVIVMRAFGCVVNDMFDRDLDRVVARTKNRPLAAGAVSFAEAGAVALFFLLLALALWWLLPPLARWGSLAALAIAVLYPLSKRYLPLPQAVLGLAFSSGLLIADMTLRNAPPSLTAWLLFGGNFLWIIAYDTIYAMADKADDLAHGGVGSAALLFGRHDVAIVSILYSLCLLWLSASGLIIGYGASYQVALIAAAVCVIRFWQKYKTRHPQACMAAFRANQWFGLFVFVGIAAAEYPT